MTEDFKKHLRKLEEILSSPAATKSTAKAIEKDLEASRESTARAREILSRA